MPTSLGESTYGYLSLNNHHQKGFQLPYIDLTLNGQSYKFLIDTGSTKSFIDPILIPVKFIQKIEPVTISTLFNNTTVDKMVKLKGIKEFKTKEELDFILFKFHSYFNGLIGMETMQKLKITLDLGQSLLITPLVQIPLKFKLNLMSATYNIAPRSKLIASVPVTKENGEVYIKPQLLNGNLIIPEGIYVSKNNYASVEVVNYSPQNKKFVIEHPIECEEISKFHTEINNIEPIRDYNTTDIKQLIRTSHLNYEERRSIEKLCSQFEEIFQKEDNQLSFTSAIKHDIELEDNKPIFSKSYRYPYIHKNEVENQISKMLNQGIIRPSFSPWSSPIWIVPKKRTPLA